MSADLKPLAWLHKLTTEHYRESSITSFDENDPWVHALADVGHAVISTPLCSLTAAQAKIGALEAELHEQASQNGMGSEREARLMARVAELEKDAVRYRYLRDDAWFGEPAENDDMVWCVVGPNGHNSAPVDGDDLDKAIDAARLRSASSAAGEATNG